jgi:hypothetical protein
MNRPAIGPIEHVGDAAAGPAQHGIDVVADSELYRAMREALRWREQEGRQRQRRKEPVTAGDSHQTSATGEPDAEGHVELYL